MPARLQYNLLLLILNLELFQASEKLLERTASHNRHCAHDALVTTKSPRPLTSTSSG
jgi:hypothetical protein